MSQFKCSLCQAGNPLPVSHKDSKSGETLVVVRCTACGHVSQIDIPSNDELEIYYSHNYRLDYKDTYKPKLKHVYRAGSAAKKRLALLDSLGIQLASSKLLDVGAGGGEFVYLATCCGALATGIEPNEGYSSYAKDEYGVEIETGMLTTPRIEKVDIVTMFHVLEHIANPYAVLEVIWNSLRPGGNLMVEVPNILQADASPSNIFFKAHIHYFSKFTLAAFASTWFSVRHIEDTGNLIMVLTRRDEVASQKLPTSHEVKFVAERLNKKGWIEYLFAGGGFAKPFRKVRSRLMEKRLEGAALELLDKYFVD